MELCKAKARTETKQKAKPGQSVALAAGLSHCPLLEPLILPQLGNGCLMALGNGWFRQHSSEKGEKQTGKQ